MVSIFSNSDRDFSHLCLQRGQVILILSLILSPHFTWNVPKVSLKKTCSADQTFGTVHKRCFCRATIHEFTTNTCTAPNAARCKCKRMSTPHSSIRDLFVDGSFIP